jgi:hypothetical protein
LRASFSGRLVLDAKLAVDERSPRRLVECLLRFEPGERPETRRAPDVAFEKPRPRRRQLEQAQRVPGRRGVEDHVLEVRRRGRVAEQLGELVEGGDLDGAGTRELLLDAPHGRIGQHAAVRSHHALAVRLCRGFRVDVQREEPGHRWNGGRRRAQCRLEDFIEVRGRVRAHESTRRPRSASAIAVAQATEVFPTPPLPVKNSYRGARSTNSIPHSFGCAARGSQHPAVGDAETCVRTTTPANAANVSRDGYDPSTAMRSSTSTSGNTSLPRAVSASLTTAVVAKAAGWDERLYRSTGMPCACNQARSAAKRGRSGSTLGPQTPVEQHMAGSKTRMVTGMGLFLS